MITKFKFYETRRKDGSIEWWTQRNVNELGVYFLIKRVGASRKFRLFVNGDPENVTDYDTLDEAMKAAEKKNEEIRKGYDL